MKQKTSVYLDDLDREAVQSIREYYGITSDTDVLCFSVRAVARALPKNTHKGEQSIIVPVQDGGLMARKQWQTDVYTSKEQNIPHLFYDETLVALRRQVSSWLLSAHPTYIKSGDVMYEKKDKHWKPLFLFTKADEQVYHDFSHQRLNIQRGPEYEERGFIDGKFSLESVKKTLKQDDPHEVNKMLQRGWHIIAFQNSQSGSWATGPIASSGWGETPPLETLPYPGWDKTSPLETLPFEQKPCWYILGHIEQDAF